MAVFLLSILTMYTKYTAIFSLVTFIIFLNGIYKAVGEKLVIANDSQRSPVNHAENLEVPNSPLLLLDRVKYRTVESEKYISRQNQDNETSSSSLCSCDAGVCKCCTGYIMNLFNQKACTKITYSPGDFAFDVQMTLNNIVLYENSMSGKNPKPFCINPPRLTNLKLCGKFYNVFFPGRNFHFCLAMYGQWRSYELFNVAFDCLRMGAQGVAMVKPDDTANLQIPNPQGGVDAVIDAGEDDIEDYDENLVRSLFGIFDD